MKIHPLFFLVAIYFFLSDKAELFAGYIVAIVLHEYGHILMAKLRGYKLKSLTIMPYGGRVSGYTYNSYQDGLLIALSGPIFNIFIAFVLMALIWLIPSMHSILIEVIKANLYLAFINLFPIYPLDGAQILFLFSKNKIKVAKLVKKLSVLFGAVFIVLTIVSIFYSFCVTLGIFGIFVVLSAFLDKDKCLFEYIYMKSIRQKNKTKGLIKQKLQVEENDSLYNLFSNISSDKITEFEVVDDNGKILATISEKDIEKAILSKQNIVKIKDLLKD